MTHDRPDLPYEKAIEAAAKTTGKALDLIESASPAIADAYVFLIGDRLAAARARNLDEITRRIKKILQDRDAKDAQPLPEQIAAPLLEHAQGEPRSEIQDLYAALLANAMDPSFKNDVRPEFVSTVRQLHPLDVLSCDSLENVMR